MTDDTQVTTLRMADISQITTLKNKNHCYLNNR